MIRKKTVPVRNTLTLAVLAMALTGNAQTSQKQQRATLRDAPPLRLTKLLQAPPNVSADWPELKGKLVVLEFWATWCTPCVDQIPHLNEMASELANQPVVFISITDDEEMQLNEFLKRTALKTWIGLDSTRKDWLALSIQYLLPSLLAQRVSC